MAEFYPWIKAAHVISVMAWMAGMLYLPRLFVYHADAAPGSELSETLKVMEHRLLRLIINPAMIASFLFGMWMLLLDTALLEQPWMWAKLLALMGLTGVHGALARWRRFFARDANMLPARTYRIVNELPTLLMAIIVILVIVRPF